MILVIVDEDSCLYHAVENRFTRSRQVIVVELVLPVLNDQDVGPLEGQTAIPSRSLAIERSLDRPCPSPVVFPAPAPVHPEQHVQADRHIRHLQDEVLHLRDVGHFELP